jgi:DNA-directed RNA polymerase specialized sigma24 family protein
MEEAKDLFHDALILYMEKERKADIHITTSPKAYLIGITRILWMQKQRKRLPSLALNEDWEGPAAMGEESKEERTALQWLQVAGQKCLQLLKAFYYDNASMSEVAQRFGLRGSRSATVQKYKCLEKIRNVVKKEAAYEASTN